MNKANFIATCAFLALSFTVDTATANDLKIRLNFQQANLQDTAKQLRQITGREIVADIPDTATISIPETGPLAANAALDVFVTALKSAGYSVDVTSERIWVRSQTLIKPSIQ
ncbi:MAG: hypothetical protein ACRDAM_19330 [Casimicrobium sp.]